MLFVGGGEEAAVRFGDFEGMKAALPRLRDSVVLPGCGHWVQQERTAAFNALLTDFLQREVPTRASPRRRSPMTAGPVTGTNAERMNQQKRSRAIGRTEVHTYVPKTFDDLADGPALVEIHVTERFTGDIEGEGTVRAIQVRARTVRRASWASSACGGRSRALRAHFYSR